MANVVNLLYVAFDAHPHRGCAARRSHHIGRRRRWGMGVDRARFLVSGDALDLRRGDAHPGGGVRWCAQNHFAGSPVGS